VLPSKTTLIFLVLTAIGVARIAATYRQIAQTSDETPNIACGMQYLDLGRYDYGAFHPPLARLAMAVVLIYMERGRRGSRIAGMKGTRC
jgi:hypothetical protein